MNRILLVDDEQNILNALKRELKNDYEIEAFTNPAEALLRCNDVSFDLVISDYKMPVMNGIQFLKQLALIRPDASRLMLSGEADMDALISAINDTHIYRFIAKPWDSNELHASIIQALVSRRMLLDIRRQAYFSRLTQTPVHSPQRAEKLYRVVLVDSDRALLTLMRNGLIQDANYEGITGAIRQEIAPGHAAPSQNFRFVVDAFETAGAALSHAEHNPLDLLITAHTLPDMNGIQLIERLKELRPDAARILTCSNPDKTILSQAINDAEVQNFLCLYWNTHDLKADVKRQEWNMHKLRTTVIQALTSRDMQLENRRLAGLQ